MSADEYSSIRRWRSRYRGLSREQRERFERIRREMTRSALGLAIDRLGLAHEHVCLRKVDVPVRLHTQHSDSALLTAWSVDIADAIARRIAAGDEGVVRYRSRIAAMADLCICVARGDTRRAWAWHRLTLCGDTPPGPERVLECLTEVDTLTLPVLKHLAAAGALPAVAALFGPADWFTLVDAAVTGAEVPPLGPPGSAWARPVGAAAVEHASRTRLAGSVLAAPLAPFAAQALAAGDAGDAGDAEGYALARAFAVLVALETEPLALWRANCDSDLAVLARALAGRAGAMPPAASGVATEPEPALPVPDAPSPLAQAGTAPIRSPERPRSTDQPPRPVLREPYDPRITPPGVPRLPAVLREKVEPAAGVPAEVLVSRAEGETAWGGLLFLLKRLDGLGLARRIGEADELAGLSRLWVLHALALRLVPIAVDDPAALAFCGLAPNRPPPEPGGEASMAVHAWIAAAAVEVTQDLRECLPAVRAEADDLVSFVCRRHARVLVDPGWVELHFDLDAVEIELRRAGLDLDPLYIPWLGVVVRFFYD